MSKNKKQLESIMEKYADFLPVPVVDIARDLGVKVYETSSLKDDESGLIRKEKDNYVIYINKFNSARRKRFTIAHELIHYILHRDFFENGEDYITFNKQPLPFMKRKEELSSDLNFEKQQREIEANKEAAKLLMPEEKFVEIWEKASAIEEVADAFDVSVSAATVRGNILMKQTMM